MRISIIKYFPGPIKDFVVKLVTELNTFKTFQTKYRHWESVYSKTSIQNGKPIPWYTYPALDFLCQFDYSHDIVFEFGSGNSSLYWADRCKKVYSIEDNENWYKQVNQQKRGNQEITLIESKEEYINSIKKISDKPTIVIIDAKYRYECAKAVADFVDDDALIILDNSDWFPETCKYLRSKKYFQIDFSGFGPIVSFTTTTSLFFTSSYKFIPHSDRQPLLSPGGKDFQCDFEDSCNGTR